MTKEPEKHSVIEGLEDAVDYARQQKEKVIQAIQHVADMDPKDKRIKLLESHLQQALDDRIPFAEKYAALEARKIEQLQTEIDRLRAGKDNYDLSEENLAFKRAIKSWLREEEIWSERDKKKVSVLEEIIELCETYDRHSSQKPSFGGAIVALIKSRMHWK